MSGYASDLTLSFPGYAEGSLPQRIAAAMLAYLQDAALVIVIRAGHLYQRELPQIRIDRRFADALFPLAQRLRPAVICLQAASKNVETTLDYNLNTRGARCLLVKMGTGMGLTPHFCAPLLTGILTVWQDLSVLAFDVELPTRRYHPLFTDDDHIHNIRAAISGLFIATSEEYRVNVTSGEQIGRIVSPFEGQVLAEIHAPVTGALLTQRRYSLVYEGSLLARVAEKCT
jgi:predicted deacylase